MKKRVYLLLSSFVFLVMMCGLLCVSVSAEESGGACGEGADWVNVRWSFNSETGVLSVTGNGKMMDFSSAEAQRWAAYRDDITAIVIGDGITRIGNHAFDGCYLASSLDLGHTVTEIGDSAFARENHYMCCVDLVLPEGLVSIGAKAFDDVLFQSITIPSTLKYCGEKAFVADYRYGSPFNVYISDLTAWCQIEFADKQANPIYRGVSYIAGFEGEFLGDPRYLYVNEERVDTLVIPDEITSIRDYTFVGAAFRQVIIPSHVTSIGTYSFAEENELNKVVLASSVTDIADYAFYSCKNLCYAYYLGTEGQMAEITIGIKNPRLTNVLAPHTTHSYTDDVCAICGISRYQFFTNDTGTYCYDDQNNEIVRGWFTIDGKNYYAKKIEGTLIQTDHIIGGKQYLWKGQLGLVAKEGVFEENGVSVLWIDGKRVTTYGWYYVGGKQYYFTYSTHALVQEDYVIGGKQYLWDKEKGLVAKEGIFVENGVSVLWVNGKITKNHGWYTVGNMRCYITYSVNNENSRLITEDYRIGGVNYYWSDTLGLVKL